MAASTPPSQSSPNIEVTHEQFQRYLARQAAQTKSPPTNKNTSTVASSKMSKRLGSMLSPKKALLLSRRSIDDQSGHSDNATMHSVEGQQSVTGTLTVISQVTIKASNRREKPQPKKNGWKKLKELVGVKSSLTEGTSEDSRLHAKSDEFYSERPRKLVTPWSSIPLRKRVKSADEAWKVGSSRETSKLDLAIRGRLDGVDALYLGDASRSAIPSRNNKARNKEPSGRKNYEEGDSTLLERDPLQHSFVGVKSDWSAANIVSEMVESSAGKEPTEIIFEGYIPGGGDRWTVRLEEESAESKASVSSCSPGTPGLQATFDDDDSGELLTTDGSPNLPTHKLWDHIWGDDAQPPPIPSHMQTGSSDDHDEEDVIQLAAACSVPIDIDEDTFMVDSPDHLRSVHELVSVPLKGRRYDSALSILKKLLKGIDPSNPKLEHLIGATHHNIGMVHLLKGDFNKALDSFQQAIQTRTRCLPPNHPDIAVSIVRKGMACLALESYDEALKAFHICLAMTPHESATRAKILNNIGIAHFFREDYNEALKSLTFALEIQRQWLDGPVRRESIVYDASVTLGNMGNVYIKKEEFDLAFCVYEESCLLQTTAFRKDHDLVLMNRSNMALVHAREGDYTKSYQLMKDILRSQQSRFGSGSEQSVETLGMMSFLLIKQDEYEHAAKCLKLVLEWQHKHLQRTHPSVQLTQEMMQYIELHTNREISRWI